MCADKPLTLPNAVVKNEWRYTSTPYMPLWHAKGQLTFTFFTSDSIVGYIKCMLKKKFPSNFNSLLHSNCWHTLN